MLSFKWLIPVVLRSPFRDNSVCWHFGKFDSFNMVFHKSY